MWLKALLLITVLSFGVSVSAQTPTQPPGCWGQVHLFGNAYGGVCTTPDPGDPQRQYVVDDDVQSDLYSVMATAAAISNNMPEQIRSAGPNGQSLASTMAGAKQVFGYVKWLFSPNSAQELLGRSLAPFGVNVLIIFTMIVALTTIYIAINLAVYLVKGAIWVINQILKLIPFW